MWMGRWADVRVAVRMMGVTLLAAGALRTVL